MIFVNDIIESKYIYVELSLNAYNAIHLVRTFTISPRYIR